jgi:hypothetical protein
MSSMGFNARLDTSHHGPPHQFKDARVVANSLASTHIAMFFFIVDSSCKHVFLCVLTSKNAGFKYGELGGHASSTYPSVTTGVTENSYSMAKMYLSSIMHSFNYNLQNTNKCFRAHVDMDIFSCFCYVELVPKVPPHLSLTLCRERY